MTRHPKSTQRLEAYAVSLELIRSLRGVLPKVAGMDRKVGSQLVNALASGSQNIGEAMRRTGRDRAHQLTIALGSVQEVRAILDVAEAFGVITELEQHRSDALADRVCAMLYRLRQTRA